VKRAALAVVLSIPLLSGCSVTTRPAPGCTAWERLGLVAQSVPTASYLPCIASLPPGWQTSRLTVRDGSTTFSLLSDRAQGRAVEVSFRSSCSAAGATPIPPRTTGGRSLLRLRSIEPHYAGMMFDVFPGGCVTYRFDFARNSQIALMAELEQAVGFVSRNALRLELHRRLDIELRP
jgi:hypothetical protein